MKNKIIDMTKHAAFMDVYGNLLPSDGYGNKASSYLETVLVDIFEKHASVIHQTNHYCVTVLIGAQYRIGEGSGASWGRKTKRLRLRSMMNRYQKTIGEPFSLAVAMARNAKEARDGIDYCNCLEKRSDMTIQLGLDSMVRNGQQLSSMAPITFL